MSAEVEKLNIRSLKGVGERRAKLFEKIGVKTVGDLLNYYPRRYLDFQSTAMAADVLPETSAALRLTVYKKVPPRRISAGRVIYKAEAGDDSAGVDITYFNDHFTPARIKENEAYIFYGKVKGTLLRREMINPLLVREEETKGLAPQYPLTEGISSRGISGLVRDALSRYAGDITEILPGELIERYGLAGLSEALRKIHFPPDYGEAERAKRRLIFDELFILQLGMLMFRKRVRAAAGAKIDRAYTREFTETLPFALTAAQKRCIGEIADDLRKSVPMSRLLQGDVGSGKTAVAAAAVLAAAKSGYQSAVMAPTEILALQHKNTFSALLKPFGVSVRFLASSVRGRGRNETLRQIAGGEADVVVGTHALIGESVKYDRLGLIIADEQHRFGVEQRMRLTKKGHNPHLLVMSATPIPRTLALMIYGDLDISVIDELPPGRKPVRTYLVDGTYRKRYLNFVKKQINDGRQAYIVCPLIEESEAADGREAAVKYKEELENGELSGFSVGLVHGKMKSKDKRRVMDAFRDGDISVLVSTTVIEVGVDVPNAAVMIVENAEVFGLSALHQLRGRVGRGADESFCVLVSDSENESTLRRLKALVRTGDGFEIARFDLKFRGPGDFFGKRQHGLPELRIADLMNDGRVLGEAREAAEKLLARDSSLGGYPVLKEWVNRMFESGDGMYN